MRNGCVTLFLMRRRYAFLEKTCVLTNKQCVHTHPYLQRCRHRWKWRTNASVLLRNLITRIEGSICLLSLRTPRLEHIFYPACPWRKLITYWLKKEMIHTFYITVPDNHMLTLSNMQNWFLVLLNCLILHLGIHESILEQIHLMVNVRNS